jgi:DNA-binding MarR family transcriptional regulator
VSEGVDVLVRRGLLTTRHSDVDRRAITLHITEAGAAAAAAGDAALYEVSETLTRELTDEKHELLNESLQVVYDAATRYFQEVLSVR